MGFRHCRDFHLPVIIHNRDKQADLIHVLWRDVKDYCLIVCWIKCVSLYGGFLLFESPPITKQRYFNIRIWRTVKRSGEQTLKSPFSNVYIIVKFDKYI